MAGKELTTLIFHTRDAMGGAAAANVRKELFPLLGRQDVVRMVFAAAPSQNEFLASLISSSGIPWGRVEAFHMDEYLRLPAGAPQGFGQFLRAHLFDYVRFGRVEFIDPNPPDPDAECARYARLLEERPIDIICMGIGENGHIAFNDPPVADFADPLPVKVVELDEACRTQQVHDGAFTRLEDVPRQAITLTVPTLMSARSLSVVVPGPRKAAAVYQAVRGPLATQCPASILRTHPCATLYLDSESAALLQPSQR